MRLICLPPSFPITSAQNKNNRVCVFFSIADERSKQFNNCCVLFHSNWWTVSSQQNYFCFARPIYYHFLLPLSPSLSIEYFSCLMSCVFTLCVSLLFFALEFTVDGDWKAPITLFFSIVFLFGVSDDELWIASLVALFSIQKSCCCSNVKVKLTRENVPK